MQVTLSYSTLTCCNKHEYCSGPRESSSLFTNTIPVAERCIVCGSASGHLSGILGSTITGGKDVCCESCVLSARRLCVGLIARPEKSLL